MNIKGQKINYKSLDGKFTGPAALYNLPIGKLKTTRIIFWLDDELKYETDDSDGYIFSHRIGIDCGGYVRYDRNEGGKIDEYINTHINDVIDICVKILEEKTGKKASD